jgi:hypothetical protein
MKKCLITTLVAVGLLATINSCSKEEQVDVKPVTVSQNPLDPDGYGYYNLPGGELYYYEDSVSVYSEANTNYLRFKPLSLEKYKDGELLDSICNNDLAVRFSSKGRKFHDKTVLWGHKPRVADEYPPAITLTIGNTLTMRFSKMVTGFGYEYNSPFKGMKWGITTRFRNSKLNKVINPVYTSYIGNLPTNIIPLGMPGGAFLSARASQTPFDEVIITFEALANGDPAPSGPFDITLAGFRYKLAK